MFSFVSEFLSQQDASFLEPDTVDTTRVNFGDIYIFNTAVTKMVYPNKSVSWRPHAVILVPSDRWEFGFCAASLIHFPINAPILFIQRNHIPPTILNEIIRLSPSGEKVPAKVLLVGPISKSVETRIKGLGLSTLVVSSSDDPYRVCADIADFRVSKISPQAQMQENDILVASGDDYSEALPASFYAAHMGTPILLTEKNAIPDIIHEFIRHNRGKNYYILGSTKTIGNDVESQIKGMVTGHVERISGTDPYSISVNFAKYQSPVDEFGWKHNKKDGYAFTYGELQKWYHIVAGALFAHLGKHTPLLLIGKGFVPDSVKRYVISVNPQKSVSHEPPYMHAYVLGDFNDISHNTQVEIDKITNMASKSEH